ncbi:hypothetical protein DAETH_07470 [Deinococcus aetherius]|uniref:Uncharacterized protein n=1 Tax=Deinococcus aetherius TaxID=200252 RepID=A0ABM8AAM6_9DEIO|nr:hypothetical protein DAETH_07470 [Deinococcus aetherius]
MAAGTPTRDSTSDAVNIAVVSVAVPGGVEEPSIWLPFRHEAPRETVRIVSGRVYWPRGKDGGRAPFVPARPAPPPLQCGGSARPRAAPWQHPTGPRPCAP